MQRIRVVCSVMVVVATACGGGKPAADKLTDAALAYLPRDTQIVVGSDITQLRTGALGAVLKEQLAADAEYSTLLRDCKLDPLAIADRVIIGVNELGLTPGGVVVVKGREMPALLACIAKLEDKVSREGDVVIFDGDGSGQLAMMAPDGSTLIGVFGFSPGAREVRDVAAKTSSLTKVPAFMDLYAGIDKSHAFWLAAKGDVLEDLDMEPAPKSVSGSVKIANRLAIAFRFRFSSSGDARQALDRYGHSLESKEPDKAKATIEQDGSDVTLRIETSPEFAREMLNELRDEGW